MSHFGPLYKPDYVKSKKRDKLKRIFSISLPVLLLFVGVYIIYKHVQTPPFAKIEQLVLQKQYRQAYEIAKELLDQDSITRIKALMYAAALEPVVTGYSQYEQELATSDTGGLYYREMFLKRLNWFFDHSQWLSWLCSIATYFPNKLNAVLDASVLEKGIFSSTSWQSVGEGCTQTLFQPNFILAAYLGKVTGNNVHLRSCGKISCQSYGFLKKDTQVILRSSLKKDYVHVFTDNGFDGYVASQYVQPYGKAD